MTMNQTFATEALKNWSDLITPRNVEDDHLRNILITASEKMEELLKNEKILLNTPIKTKNPLGIIVEARADKPKENKPTIFQFDYSIDTDILKQWLEEHSYLEGPMSFKTRGITFIYPEKKVEWQKYHKVECIIDSHPTPENKSGKIFIDIFIKGVSFVVHRDVFNDREWIVSQTK